MHIIERSAAVAAALAVFVSAGAGLANAADLGGGCCGDLEERVAELEATTARKGNRTVSLNISGQVSKALLIWDDGVNSDAFVVDNAINTSRIAFDGKAVMTPGWTAGFLVQIDLRDSVSVTVSQTNDEGLGAEIQIRTSYVYIDSEKFGRIAIGQNYSLNDAISVPFQVANTFNTDGGPYADGFSLMTSAGTSAGFNWGNLIGDGPRRDDYVRYDSPIFGGFGFMALIGDNDVWEVGAKYFTKTDRFQLNSAIDYFDYDASALPAAGGLAKFQEVKGIVSVKDLPTGLFLTVWAAQRDYERPGGFEDTGYSLQGLFGIEKNFTSYGNTTIYGGYGRFNDMASTGVSANGLGANVGGDGSADDFITGAKVDRVTLGVVQSFDSAGLDIYAIAEHYSADITVSDNGSGASQKADVEDFSSVIIGSRIKF
jgi:hypothetical protein